MKKHFWEDEIFFELSRETQEIIRDVINLDRQIKNILAYNKQLMEQAGRCNIKIGHKGKRLTK